MTRIRQLLSVSLVLIIGAFALTPHFSVQAATFDLTTCDPSATVNGAALAAAITTANGNGQPDTINLGTGCVYTPANRIWIGVDSGNAVTINGNNAILAATPGRALLGLDFGGTATLNNLTFRDGDAGFDTDNGGAILNRGTMTINGSFFFNNVADINGGAIFHQGDAITVSGSTFQNNRGLYGGAIEGQGGPITVINSTFTGNSTPSGGSGGAIDNLGDILTIHSSTFTGNSSPVGSDILFNGLGGSITNSIVASTNGCRTATGLSILARNNYLLGSCSLAGGSTGNISSGALNLGSLIGFPPYFIPGTGSVAIDAGNSTLLPSGVTTDQRGLNRTSGTNTDLGAIETDGGMSLPTVSLTGIASINEGSSTSFTLSRTGATTNPLVVTLTVTLTGLTSPTDYTLSGGSISGQSGTVTALIPVGASSVTITFNALNDGSSAEPDEALGVVIAANTALYNINAGANNAGATINANGLIVTNTSDSGEGSLRQAITNANAFASNDTITFAASANGTITLVSALPSLANNGSLNITGNGAASTIISGNNAVRVFNVSSGATVTIQDVTVTNGLIAGNGGGINNQGTLTLNNSTISNNLAQFGGGIFNNSGTLTVTDSTFSGNTATTNGGGIQNNFGTLTVTNSTFNGNTATTNSGGGMHVDSGTVTVTSSRFSGNSAFSGGGIFNGGTLTVNNSAVSGNSAFGGGGIYAAFGTLTANNSTFSGNGAISAGGNILSDSTVTLNNSIVANSTQSVDCVRNAGTINASHSLIRDGLGCVNGTNTNNLTGNPLLDANLIPQVGSPAINSGDNALIPGGITTDLAGNARIQGGTVDRGAYETGFAPPSVTITVTDADAAETGPDSGTFQITRTGATTTVLTVSYTIGGTADASDYTPALTGTVDIPIGQASVDVTITPVDDAIDESDETVILTLVDAAGYDLGAETSATVTIADNDTAGIMVDIAGLVSVPEDDTTTTTTFTLAAETEPTADVLITVTPDAQCDAGSGGGTAVTVTLLAGSTAPQTVTVLAVDDAVAEAAQHDCLLTLSAASTDLNFNGLTLADVPVTILDNDIEFSVTTSGDAAEGTGTDTVITFTVTPGAAIANVGGSVSYAVTDTSGTTTIDDFSAALPSGTLTFSAGDGAQQVQVTVIGDMIDEPDFALEFAITAMTSGTTGTPSSVGAPDPVTITDDDSAGVTVTESDGSTDVTEGGAPDTFTVRLNTAPVSPVTITLTPDAGLTLSTTALNFDAANWMTEQIVEVTADDDTIAQGPRTASIALAVTTAGADYTGIVIPTVSVNISDNDSAGIVISPNTFSVTEGLTRSYQIRLVTTPTVAPVTVWVEFDTVQLTVNGNSAPFALVFSDATPQTISFSVNGSDEINTIRDLVITHTVTNSAAPEYPVGTGANVSLQIVDYPPPPPTPLCEAHNFDEGGVVRSSITDALGYAINCRILFQNGASTSWLGTALYSEANLGVPGLLELGVQQAVDIFSPPGMTYFEGGAVFCLRGQGTLIWLAASGMPRHPEIIGSYTVPDFPGFTCATLFEPGTLILVSRNPVGE